MKCSHVEPPATGRCVALQPMDQLRGPPRAVYDFGETNGISQAYVLEAPLNRPLEDIRLYFISAGELDEPVKESQLPNPCGINFVPPSMNKHLPEEKKTRHWNHHHILLPEQPPFVDLSDSKVTVNVGPGGTPSQYDLQEPYIFIRSWDGTTIEFEPPTEGTICISLSLEARRKRYIDVPLPPTVPGLKADQIPTGKDILDAVRIEISQQGYPHYLSLHIRLVAAQSAVYELVQPHIYNIGKVELLDTEEEKMSVGEEMTLHYNYRVRLNPLKPNTYRNCLKGGPRDWRFLPESIEETK